MNNLLRRLDYFTLIKYALFFGFSVILNNLEKTVYPYSAAALIAASFMGGSPVALAALSVASFAVTGANGLLAQAAIAAVFCAILQIIRKKTRAVNNFGFIAVACFSLVGFIMLGDTSSDIIIEKRVMVSLITCGLAFFTSFGAKAIAEKGLKFKFSFEEALSVAASVVALGIGICNFASPSVWKGVAAFLTLLCCYLFRFTTGTFIAAVFGISSAVYYHDVTFVAVFLCIGLAADLACKISRYLSAAALPVADFVIYGVFGVYNGYSKAELLPLIIATLAFVIIPSAPLKKLKEKLYSFREKQLVRQTINRNRLMLSNRLYELAGVFTEMASAFNAFKKTAVTEEKAKAAIEKEIYETVCKTCKYRARCEKSQSERKKSLKIMVDVGFAKGKLSLIDLPKELAEICFHPNEILFGLNKMLAKYRAYAVGVKNLENGRELIASEAAGVSEILRGLALESGALLKYQSRTERTLNENLMKHGFFAAEVLIYGENERLSVSMIVAMKTFSVEGIKAVVDKTLGVSMTLAEKSNITEEKIYLSFKRTVEYDAVFGVAKATKDGSEKSGDTHSVIRISDEKFLVALSDGMGSGKEAETVSSVSLSLIESFYKAGMDSELILNTVNKLLSVNTEDSFTALDVAVVNLKDLSADFVKYGSPYGYIISDGRVRIVEANSLPLGILNDLNPSVCTAELNDGDMLLLMTDGVADAFGSSGDVIDYVRIVPALNPQSLADDILGKAVELSDGKKKDDMTVLCVRIFKKPQSA